MHGGVRLSRQRQALLSLVNRVFNGEGCRFATFNVKITAYLCALNVWASPWQEPEPIRCRECQNWEYDEESGLVDDLVLRIEAGEVQQDGYILALDENGDLIYHPSDLLDTAKPTDKSDPLKSDHPTRDQVAEEFHVSAGTVQRSAELADAIDKIAESTDPSVRTDLLGDEIKATEKDIKEVGTMDEDEQRAVIDAVRTGGAQTVSEAKEQVIARSTKSQSVFNYQKTPNIRWAKWSFNPFTGCIHGCIWCYACEIAERLYEHGFEPTFHESRLDAPFNTKIPKAKVDEPGIHNVFLGSMTDFFGDGTPDAWINRVLEVVKESPQWQYMVLTKRPERIKNFAPFPVNLWIGVTVCKQDHLAPALAALGALKGGRPRENPPITFISFEPLEEYISFRLSKKERDDARLRDTEGHRLPALHYVNLAILGGRSKTKKVSEFHPPWHWVETIQMQARKAKSALYFKPNLGSVPEEYPLITGGEAL